MLQSYAGYYQLDEHRVIIVAQAGDHLSASFNMVRRMKLVPESANGFFMPGNDLQVSFVRPPAGGAATGLVLRQHGVTYPTAARTGAAAIEAGDAFAAERFARQVAVPGGEQILRRNLDMQGELQLDDFSPEFGAVAQRIIERVSGMSYYDYVDQKVYRPAGMKDTDSLPEKADVRDRANGYMRRGGIWQLNTNTLPYRGMAAGGGYSTAHDLLAFARALEAGTLVSKAMLDQATEARGVGDGFGLGFMHDGEGISRMNGHNGGATGMNGALWI
ncbi:MAG: serine hydrolase domain-containing protein [Telluria sp.]